MNPAIILAGYISLLLVLSFILIKAANVCVSAAHAVLNRSHANKFGLALFFIALTQCLPEMLIALVASVNRNSQIAVAAVIGSNLANISFILGGAALVAGSLRAADKFIKQEIGYVLLIGALPPLLLLDSQISRLEAVVLILVYLIYLVNELNKKRKPEEKIRITELHHKHLWLKLTNHTFGKKMAVFLAGTGVMLLASEAIVRVTESMAQFASIPAFLITLIIISIGTSLPELVFEIVAIRRRETSMAFASVLGSIVTDSTLTLGISALIFPITLGDSLRSYLISIIGFILMFGLFWRFVWTKHRLDRVEGAALIVVYGLFAALQYLMR